MRTIFQTKTFLLIFLIAGTIKLSALSGGPLSTEQAAYDVKYYELDLSFDIEYKSISGSLLCRAEIVNEITSFVLDLDERFNVDSVLVNSGDGTFTSALAIHRLGQITITLPNAASIGDVIEVKVFYNGSPREAQHPPWDDGFVWETTQSGGPWIGVACEGGGADTWWPCKDHPSDEPDTMTLNFTVPQPLQCVSNGSLVSTVDNADNTTTFNWFISYPINNYNVSFYIAEFNLIEDNYPGVSGENIPFKFWVLPEAYNTALQHMDVFKNEFDFLESVCGPFPFSNDKHGWAHAPYWGMEHQSIIAYGHDFSLNSFGFDYIHYHELAHEWWGNLITAKDWSDVWIHEGLATYMEALYVENISGRETYLQFIDSHRPEDNHSMALAPRNELTADEAFDFLNSYNRGSTVIHTLRYYLGDETFLELLARWAYPDPNDLDNTNGRQCRILSTDDMKNQAEEVTGVELDAFFEVFFRQASYPRLAVERGANETTFEWQNTGSVTLGVDVPIRVNGEDQTVDMSGGTGSAAILPGDYLIIDPERWILMASPVITTIEDDLNLVNDFKLNQNFPNPFNPETTITFQIPERSHTLLKIYDLLGNEVTTLVNEQKPAGAHQIRFSGTNLPSGIYFYTMQAGKFTETKKLMLIK